MGSEIKKIYDKEGNELGLYDLCDYWMLRYPDDIFIKEPKEIVAIRNLMKIILAKFEVGEYR